MPSGGLGAAGSSGGRGVSVFLFQRTRSALAGAKRCAPASRTAGSSCRSGVTLSRIQNPRPCVPATRSSSFTTRSRTDVAGMFTRSDCQRSPPSNETQTCRSVPAYSRSLRFGSSRTAFTIPSFSGIPAVTCAQVFPPSRVR